MSVGTTFDKAMPGGQIVAHRAENAVVVDAVMLEKAPVLDGHDRIHQIGRDLVIGEKAALDAVSAGAQPGNEQRLELVAGQLLAVRIGNRIDHPVADMNGGAVGRVIGLRAGCTVICCPPSLYVPSREGCAAPVVV